MTFLLISIVLVLLIVAHAVLKLAGLTVLAVIRAIPFTELLMFVAVIVSAPMIFERIALLVG